jgi:N-acetylglutamate synthase-like GNAT family acetyltransferase
LREARLADILPTASSQGEARFTLVSALESDFPAIKALIHETGINPMGLDWRRFTIAKTLDGQFIGCGQLKPHGDGSVELASIAVTPAWRKKGVASSIIRKLMADAPRPLYLTCLSNNEPFYEKFGFRAIHGNELPKYFRRLSKMAGLINALNIMQEKMLVMKLD